MMIQKFNSASQKWEPYQPGARTYPPLPAALRSQLDQITPSSSVGSQYWPTQVALKNGTRYPRVFFARATDYIRSWGMWPSDHAPQSEISLESIETIAESEHRLPMRFADEVFRGGESGMGYTVFKIVYKGGSDSAHVCNGVADFVDFPVGKRTNDVSAVILHSGRDVRPLRATPEYVWCLFG